MRTSCLFAAVFLTGALAQAGPRTLTYQGSVLDPGGEPVPDGTYDMHFQLFHDETGGVAYWTETDLAVPVTNGLFSTILGDGSFFGTHFNSDFSLWLEVAIDRNGNGTFEAGEVFSPRRLLAGAAWAVEADRLQGRSAADFAPATHSHAWGEITAIPAGFADGIDNDTHDWASITGIPAGFADGVDDVGTGDITAVNAGTGLSGGGLTGDVTVSADPSYLQRRVTGQAPAGSYITAINEDGTVVTGIDADSGGDITEVNAGTGLTGGGTAGAVSLALDPGYVGGLSWSLSGNAGTSPTLNFLGTVDAMPLELRTSDSRVLRLEPHTVSPNLIGGYDGNTVTPEVVGATIDGGGTSGTANLVTDDFGTIGGGEANQAGDADSVTTDAAHATVAGGFSNTAAGQWSAIGGGWLNVAMYNASTVAGGLGNAADGASATVGGGNNNTASGFGATVGGGQWNETQHDYATVPGGSMNTAAGLYSFAAGRRAKANHDGAFVWADSTDADFSSTADNEFRVRAGGGATFETGGAGAQIDGNTAWHAGNDGAGSGLDADLLDGQHASSFWNLNGNSGTTSGTHFLGTIDNQPLQLRVNNVNVLRLEPNGTSPNVIGGHSGNSVAAGVDGATIGGGGRSGVNINSVTADQATISGGYRHTASGAYSAIGGGYNNTASGSGSFVGGGRDHASTASYSTIAGGRNNRATAAYATVDGGRDNRTTASYSTIGGGLTNANGGQFSVLGGGLLNTVSANRAVLGGGEQNKATGGYATVGGGGVNTAGGGKSFATVGGGAYNGATGEASTVPGGISNAAAGDYSFAAGRRAKANHNGAFVWADSTNADFASTTTDQFAIRAGNGVYLAANAGNTKSVGVGERYRDNGVIAWAKINAPGTVLGTASFGIATVGHVIAGVYEITLTATCTAPETLVPMATAEVDGVPVGAAAVRIVSIDQVGPRVFNVYINNGLWLPVDNDFVFMVTGR